MLHSKVRQVLELLDPRVEQDGKLRYRALEEALAAAVQLGDERSEADLSLEMGIRLVSISTMAQATTQHGQAGGRHRGPRPRRLRLELRHLPEAGDRGAAAAVPAGWLRAAA